MLVTDTAFLGAERFKVNVICRFNKFKISVALLHFTTKDGKEPKILGLCLVRAPGL